MISSKTINPLFPFRKKTFLILSSLFILSSFSFISLKFYFDGKTPEESLSDLEVAQGLEVYLFASEPMISNPTNIDVDARGRVWVCEGINYRLSLNPNNPVHEKGDRIVILEDTDGDGKADKSKVFYQGKDVNAALGIAVLGNKVYVSSSPNIFVFTDENGDDVADKKEILFTGLQGVDHDHGTHSVNFGPDGKLYFTIGNEGKVIKDKNGNTITDKAGNKVVTDGKPYREGMILRCNVDGTELEVMAHNFRNNYEAAVDAFGTIWQSDNDDDGNKSTRINYVMEHGNYGYKDEMTGASWHSRRTNMEKEIPFRHWHLNDPGVVPSLLHTGSGSPTGMLIYEGNLLPEVFRNQMIHCEPGHNVVRAYPVKPKNAGYEATIVPILKSKKDQWFRPSDVSVAPDGSLMISDWYDPGVGGHQMKDPNGGRIYRVAPSSASYKIPKYDFSSYEGAAQALKNPNLATRYLAFTKLNDGSKSAEKALQALWKDANPRFRARAFWLLYSSNKKYVKEALSDENPDLRISAIRGVKWSEDDVIPVIKKLKNDPSEQVRRELVLALRHNKSTEAPALWTELAQKYNGEDRWYLEALGIAADKNWDSYFSSWIKSVGENWNTKAGRDLVWRSRAKDALPYLAKLINDPSIQNEEKLRYFRAFDFHTDNSKHATLASLLETLPKDAIDLRKMVYSQMDIENAPKTVAFKTELNNILDQIKGGFEFITIVKKFQLKERSNDLIEIVAKDPYSDLALEAAHTALSFNETAALKAKAISSDKKEAEAVLKVLGRIDSEQSRAILKSVFMDKSADIDQRKLAVQGFATGWGGEEALVDLLKSNLIPKEIEKDAALRLLYAGRENIKNEGAKYLTVSTTKLPPITELSKEKGNVEQGQIIFNRTCISCHQVNGRGINFGPDLSEIGSKLPKEALLYAIMEPNAGISFGFEGYQLKMENGENVVGIISSETENEIEVKKMGGVVSKYDKNQLVSKEQFKNSLMPDLLLTMNQQELVDLVEYLAKLERK